MSTYLVGELTVEVRLPNRPAESYLFEKDLDGGFSGSGEWERAVWIRDVRDETRVGETFSGFRGFLYMNDMPVFNGIGILIIMKRNVYALQ
jgi:hypothetical protein